MKKKKKIALITGITGDIGKEIAIKLKKEGYFIVGITRDSEKADSIRKFLGCEYCYIFISDITNENSFESIFTHNLFEEKTVSLIIHSAGVLKMGNMDDHSRKDWDKILATNLSSTFNLVSSFLKSVRKSGNTLFIIFGSRWGRGGAENAPAYSAAKSGLRGFVKSLQKEFHKTGFRFILISPGSVDSEMSRQVDPHIKEKLISPRDIALLVEYVSKTPNYIIFDEIGIKSYPYDLK
ncbi:SDR family oxidoreductase [Virgibacillus sp. Bac330]|uniref:SDR family oxidoreductase n=1 Tax=Virgibacillus sp. Bac330 TaxID=2419841 RepID=UPI000EF54E74|nr:SDR family oxidoreductase [Virgibacillus sp. Bac330]